MSEAVVPRTVEPSRRRRRRGQSMVEFALVLPLLLLLLCGAVDFGRVFFSWVQLTNVARVGANYAASHPDAWGTPGNAAERSDYAAAMANEAAGISCTPAPGAPTPTFPAGRGMGDQANVALSCHFDLITPFMESFFGADYTIRAESTFPIRSGCVGCPPEPTPTPLPTPTPTPSPVPCSTVPDLVGITVGTARSAWSANGFTGGFLPSNAPNANIVLTQQTNPASSPGQCLIVTASVTITSGPPPPPTCAVVPNMFGMTLHSARSAWSSAGFTGAFNPATGFNTETVLSQTTSPSASPGQCVPFATTVTVAHGPAPTPVPTPTPAPCIVPSFVGTNSAQAESTWTTAGFAQPNLKFDKPGQRPYTIQSQSLVGGSVVPCSAKITVGP